MRLDKFLNHPRQLVDLVYRDVDQVFGADKSYKHHRHRPQFGRPRHRVKWRCACLIDFTQMPQMCFRGGQQPPAVAKRLCLYDRGDCAPFSIAANLATVRWRARYRFTRLKQSGADGKRLPAPGISADNCNIDRPASNTNANGNRRLSVCAALCISEHRNGCIDRRNPCAVDRRWRVGDPQCVDCIADNVNDQSAVRAGNFRQSTKKFIHHRRQNIGTARAVTSLKRSGERGKTGHISNKRCGNNLVVFRRTAFHSACTQPSKHIRDWSRQICRCVHSAPLVMQRIIKRRTRRAPKSGPRALHLRIERPPWQPLRPPLHSARFASNRPSKTNCYTPTRLHEDVLSYCREPT